MEIKACAQSKNIDLEKLRLAKENKNPTRDDKEDLLLITRCLFKQEFPTSEACKVGLEQSLSEMSWFQ